MRILLYARADAPKERTSQSAALRAPTSDHWPMSDPRDLLIRELPLIERITRAICRRNGLDPDSIEDFTAEVRLRLVKDDYAILRAYEGRSQFKTYIAAVVRRLLIDQRRRDWGKWHDSAEAQRIGEIGVDVERSLHREGRSIQETHRQLEDKYPGVALETIEVIAARLPAKMRRNRVDIDEAMSVQTHGDAERPVVQADLAARISTVVCTFIDGLPEEDQLLLRLRFDSEMTVAQIARSLHRDQQVLYRRLYKHFHDLRDALTAASVDAQSVEELIGSDTTLLDFRLKKRTPSPSEGDESAVAARQEEDTSS
ncbi:MAG TPA: sigma-70 family RNA polymerase sigma factor [Thermoanaerobaculia bacterium]|nr:sigma-70 family RNA polymerase sigma factor [Thermoanaerobaculia bacterium]